MKNNNLEWRTRLDRDPKYCKKSCCWTPFNCGRAYECRCHQPMDVNK